MKFLVDECLSPQLATWLTAHGHDAQHVVDAGLGGATDEHLMRHAAQEGRALVSADTDFGELLARKAAALPSIILFRGRTRTAHEQAETLLANLEQFEADLVAGAVVVISGNGIRVRRLPLGGA